MISRLKKLKDIYGVLRIVECNEWKQSGFDEESRDRKSDLTMVKWMKANKVIGLEFFIGSFFFWGLKKVIIRKRR